MLMQDMGTAAICCTPSYALHLAEVMEKNKVDVSKYHELRTEYERLAHEIINDPFKVLTENGRHVASIIGMDDSVCREALEMGAVAAGVTGTGPAIAIVCEQSLTEEISRKFKNTIVCRVR
jgi:shikimate kinase